MQKVDKNGMDYCKRNFFLLEGTGLWVYNEWLGYINLLCVKVSVSVCSFELIDQGNNFSVGE